MPEMPDVEALAAFLRAEMVGQHVAAFELGSFSALKTTTPSPSALPGNEVVDVTRRGKYLIVQVSDIYVITHHPHNPV